MAVMKHNKYYNLGARLRNTEIYNELSVVERNEKP